MKTFAFFCSVLLLTGLSLRAQTPTMKCDGGNWNNGARSCEIREITVPGISKLTVDSGKNGGISVRGADRSDILVRTKVEAWGNDDGAAKAIGAQVIVHASGGSVSAAGPADNWSTSYEIFVPRRTALSLQAHNGGLNITGINAAMEFHTVNGGVNLKEVGGDVHGDTHNGGINVTLTGMRWEGNVLDVSTENGGVNIKVPEAFSAQFEASTVNGGMNVSLPNVTVGKRDREVKVMLGAGGPLVRVRTHNGGVNLTKV